MPHLHLWVLATWTAVALSDSGSSAGAGCSNSELHCDTAKTLAGAADGSKVGSCLLQAHSGSSARRGTALEEGEVLESTLTDSVAIDLQPTAEEDDVFLSPTYWVRARNILETAARSTTTAAPINMERPAGGSAAQDWANARPWVQAWEHLWDRPSQPISTRLGAAVLYGVSVDEHTASTPTPPPTQEFARSNIHGNCPMVILPHELQIFPPLCGETQGTWTGVKVDRVPLRWEKVGHGVRFGVDSFETGNGSATFASIEPELVLNRYEFSVLNCAGKAHYSINEEIIKVEHMGDHDVTAPHDAAEDSAHYLLRYSVLAENGSILMQTNMFRMFSDEFNFTAAGPDPNEPFGGELKLVAHANRVGQWTQNGWRSCKRNARGWHVEFPQHIHDQSLSDGSTGTLNDLRTLATMVVTFMAARDEDRDSSTGLAPEGESEVFMNFLWTFIVVILAALIACCICCLCIVTGAKDKLRKVFFRCEGAFMPKPPHVSRAAELQPVW